MCNFMLHGHLGVQFQVADTIADMPRPRETDTPLAVAQAAAQVVERTLPAIREAIRDAAAGITPTDREQLQAIVLERAETAPASARPPRDPRLTDGAVEVAVAIDAARQLGEALNRRIIREALDDAIAADRPRPGTATQTVAAYAAGLAGRGSIDRAIK